MVCKMFLEEKLSNTMQKQKQKKKHSKVLV